MNIITPPRIDSLESRTIRVIDHSGGPPWTFQAYPFDSILSLKQQITLHYATRTYFPSALFIAEKTPSGFRPLEFRWEFATTLEDPLSPEARKPSKDLMEGDVRKPVFPTILAGVTYESMGSPAEIHVWPLAAVVKGLDLTPVLVAGFVQLYYPMLETVAAVESLIAADPLTDAEKTSLEAIRLFQEGRQIRLARLESLLGSGEGPTLQELRALRIMLPQVDLGESLEIVFHTMTPTRHLPVLRYFSANQRTPPLLKLATSAAGIPMLADAKLLRALLGDAPAAEQGSMIVGKVPLLHPKAPFGAAWVLRIYETGSAEIVLGAPRRDAPLVREVVLEAFQQLRGFLESTPWNAINPLEGDLQELTATYKYTLQQDIRKPSKSELRKRGDPFTPLFKEEAALAGEINLRWKAVSNFSAERDPIMSYIADLFLKESLQSVDRIPVAAYVAAITREFGLGPTEAGAALTTWINRHAEYVLLDTDAPEKAVAKFGVGAAVSLYNHHPDYLFSLAGVTSYMDLRRIVSMLEIWVSHTAQELSIGAVTTQALEEEAPQAPPAPAPEEPAIALEDVGQMEDWYQAMEMYGALNESEAPAENTTTVQNVQPQPEVEPEVQLGLEKDVRYPDPIAPDEAPLQPLDQYLIQRLQSHDNELFSYKTEKATKLYSRTCQSSSNKQPNVMSPEAYRRVRSLYGDSVHWVEAPLSKYEIAALHFTSKAVRERIKDAKTLRKTLEEVLEYEKHMLRLGMPLKEDASIVQKWKEAPVGASAEMEVLIAQQKSKPLWLVLRAGTNRANYYICAEFWCIRDDLPLIDAEFEGTVSRRGTPKPPNTCPFCGGKELERGGIPKAGETVLRRGKTTKSKDGVVARYIGFGPELFHPKGFIVPCCFTEPGSLIPPAESQPFPVPVVELPTAQQGRAKTPEEKAALEPAIVRNLMEAFQDVKIKLDVTDVAGLPEDTYRFIDKDKTKVELRAKAIVRAYILSATSFPLEVGKIGLVSETMDTFFGQSAKEYLESPKHGKIYTHPKVRGQAFFRVGLGTKLRNIGAMMLQLVAYARTVVSHIMPPYITTAPTQEQLLTDLFETQEILTFQAFQQANYGTLVTEFADPDARPTPGELQTWCGRMGIPLPGQRAYAEALYGAWHRFKAYVADPTQRKELRLWEHLFTAPGLFTMTGVLLAVVTTDENDHVIIRCPSLGIAPRHQISRPPLLLLYEERRTRIVEPLALYAGPDQLLGVLDPDSVAFGHLPAALRTPLAAFYSDYMDPKGCGKPQPAPHPWMDDAPQTGVPRLGSLLAMIRRIEGAKTQYLLRDRSRRLVGIVVAVAGDVPLFVPAVDDGTIDISLGSLYDIEALPTSPLGTLLQFLVGPSITEITGLAKYFPGLMPAELRSQQRERSGRNETLLVALETKGGCLIPLEPLKLDAVVAHPMMTQLRGSVQIDELPWMALAPVNDPVLLQNPEERLEETYQHVRLTLSEWLQTEVGQPYKRAIEDLRGARTRLPLYELRKRMDLLLQPVIAKWIHVGKKGAHWDISTLRRNCLKVTKGKCDGACVWLEGQESCLIHAAPTDRFVDPVYVVGARIVDELLRTHEPALQVLEKGVARLRPPVGIVREKDSLLVSFEGRGDATAYRAIGLEGRLPTRYTQGLVIPEEMGSEDVGCEGSVQGIPLTWEGVTHMVWPAQAVGQPVRDIAWAALVGEPVRTETDYKRVADTKGWNILFTRDSCHGFQLVGRIKPTKEGKGIEERMFVILTPDRIPLGSAKTKQPILKESELPSAILTWLDESPKEEKKVLEEILEEEESENVQPYEQLEDELRVVNVPLPQPQQKPKKECPEGQEISTKSGKCVKKCAEDEVRTEAGRCKKVRGVPPAPLQMVVEEIKPEVSVLSPEPSTVPETDINVSKYDVGRCEKSKGQSAAFPFKREDILEALKEQGVAIKKSWKMDEICARVTDDTLRILERRRTRKNRK